MLKNTIRVMKYRCQTVETLEFDSGPLKATMQVHLTCLNSFTLDERDVLNMVRRYAISERKLKEEI